MYRLASTTALAIAPRSSWMFIAPPARAAAPGRGAARRVRCPPSTRRPGRRRASAARPGPRPPARPTRSAAPPPRSRLPRSPVLAGPTEPCRPAPAGPGGVVEVHGGGQERRDERSGLDRFQHPSRVALRRRGMTGLSWGLAASLFGRTAPIAGHYSAVTLLLDAGDGT